jgi:hypothetical protein
MGVTSCTKMSYRGVIYHVNYAFISKSCVWPCSFHLLVMISPPHLEHSHSPEFSANIVSEFEILGHYDEYIIYLYRIQVRRT